MIKKQPEGITVVLLEAVLMPNGEVICLGKTVGWLDTHKAFLHLASDVFPTGVVPKK